jgi:antitoxin CptB
MTGDALGRLRWHCRRGMKELDVALQNWLEHRYGAASSEERQLFQQFLELPDPVIAAYLLGREQPEDPRQHALVTQLRQAASPAAN